MRDLILFGVIFALLPVCFFRPYIGVLLFSCLGYMNPHRLAWGAAYDFPFAQLVMIATLAGVAVYLLKKGRLSHLSWQRESVLMLLLWIMYTITSFAALYPEVSKLEWEEITKIFLVSLLTLVLFDDQKKLRYLLLVIAGSLGFHGLKGGIFSLMTAGQYRVWGPEGSMIADNNALALALNMVLPILFFLAKTEDRVWFKRLLQVTFVMSAVAVMFTYSRGGFLGLAVVVFLLFFSLNVKQKVVVILLALALSPVFISRIPEQWTNRIGSIKTYEEDASAQSRIAAWTTAWRLTKDRPWTGGGFNVVDMKEAWEVYNPEAVDSRAVHISGVHSIYLEVMSENGLIAFGIFIALIVSSITSMRKVRRKMGKKDELGPLYYCSRMCEISLFAYAISGAFQEFASFDLFYHIVAIVILTKCFVPPHENAVKASNVEPTSGLAQTPGGTGLGRLQIQS